MWNPYHQSNSTGSAAYPSSESPNSRDNKNPAQCTGVNQQTNSTGSNNSEGLVNNLQALSIASLIPTPQSYDENDENEINEANSEKNNNKNGNAEENEDSQASKKKQQQRRRLKMIRKLAVRLKEYRRKIKRAEI